MKPMVSATDGTDGSANEGERHLVIEPRIVEQRVGEQAGHEVLVTIIQGGTSRNGYCYNDEVLHGIARMIEGAQAYADHARNIADAATRSVRDVVGFYHDAHFVAGDGAQPARVDATLHIFAAADWLWSLIQEAVQIGRPELVGLSIGLRAVAAQRTEHDKGGYHHHKPELVRYRHPAQRRGCYQAYLARRGSAVSGFPAVSGTSRRP